MENAADALKIAFAVFVFVIALTIVFSLLGKIKETADAILFYSDKTNYYSWQKGSLKNGRVVGEDAIISALNNYKAESLYITITEANGKKIESFVPLDGKTTEDILYFIDTRLNTDKTTYYENVTEVTLGGSYVYADDGTKVTVEPGRIITYVTYTKIG